jgi:hypothetical protein
MTGVSCIRRPRRALKIRIEQAGIHPPTDELRDTLEKDEQESHGWCLLNQ